MSLFQAHEDKQRRLDEMAGELLKIASLLGLHAWYKMDRGGPHPVLQAAAEDAEEAALILLGQVSTPSANRQPEG